MPGESRRGRALPERRSRARMEPGHDRRQRDGRVEFVLPSPASGGAVAAAVQAAFAEIRAAGTKPHALSVLVEAGSGEVVVFYVVRSGPDPDLVRRIREAGEARAVQDGRGTGRTGRDASRAVLTAWRQRRRQGANGTDDEEDGDGVGSAGPFGG